MERKKISLAGCWSVQITQDGATLTGEAAIPGTLDENRIGSPEEPGIATRFTRKYRYDGPARYVRRLTKEETSLIPEGAAVYLVCERSRLLTLEVDGKAIPRTRGSLSTPWCFDVGGLLREGTELALTCDNTYPGLPAGDILYSSAATDETQTNWNGLLGFVGLQVLPRQNIKAVRIYPRGDEAEVEVEFSGISGITQEGGWQIRLTSEAFNEKSICCFLDGEGVRTGKADSCQCDGTTSGGGGMIRCRDGNEMLRFSVKLSETALRWDEYEGNLHPVRARLVDPEGHVRDTWEGSFGIRTFGDDGTGRLAVNGRRFFLRGEASCAEFPETGYEPLETAEWMAVLEQYRAYGVNTLRFHSHCPPEAAFAAADRTGMMLQPELSCWNPKDALMSGESVAYYETELREILDTYANHPSFVMLSLGNELNSEEPGFGEMARLVRLARGLDPTRLYAIGSNVAYGRRGCDEESGFYTSSNYKRRMLRATSANMGGHLNRSYPSADKSYQESMEELRKSCRKPVFGFEVGQYEVLPDFDELADFHGISDPENYRIIQAHMREKGLEGVWRNYVEAGGELALLSYREEVEAVLRTPSMSGLSLLGLQDFPGQGTALVGMMNAHLKPKPYAFARPERFAAFFRPVLPLLLLEKYTYTTDECLRAEVKIANYGKSDLSGTVRVSVRDEQGECLGEWTFSGGEDGAAGQPACEDRTGSPLAGKGSEEDGLLLGQPACEYKTCEKKTCEDKKGSRLIHKPSCAGKTFPQGELTGAGTLTVDIAALGISCPAKLLITVSLDAQEDVCNTYPVWVYPEIQVEKPSCIHETASLDEEAMAVLGRGGMVYLSPPSTKEALPRSIQGQFTTDFWSVGTFPSQEGGMGQLIDAAHPLFGSFPTESHTDYQWYPMASARAILLKEPRKSIITEMDCYSRLRPMTQLLECRCAGGRLLLSSMGLQDLQQYPEARALLRAIYQYMSSDAFCPEQEIPAEEIRSYVS